VVSVPNVYRPRTLCGLFDALAAHARLKSNKRRGDWCIGGVRLAYKSLDANKELKTPLYSDQESFYAPPSDPIGQTGAEVRKRTGCAPEP